MAEEDFLETVVRQSSEGLFGACRSITAVWIGLTYGCVCSWRRKQAHDESHDWIRYRRGLCGVVISFPARFLHPLPSRILTCNRGPKVGCRPYCSARLSHWMESCQDALRREPFSFRRHLSYRRITLTDATEDWPVKSRLDSQRSLFSPSIRSSMSEMPPPASCDGCAERRIRRGKPGVAPCSLRGRLRSATAFHEAPQGSTIKTCEVSLHIRPCGV